MKLPKIAADDALLFGSLFLLAVGSAVAIVATTDNALLAIGVGLMAFGLPSALLSFMAAGEETP
jgi:hypothetical protein